MLPSLSSSSLDSGCGQEMEPLFWPYDHLSPWLERTVLLQLEKTHTSRLLLPCTTDSWNKWGSGDGECLVRRPNCSVQWSKPCTHRRVYMPSTPGVVSKDCTLLCTWLAPRAVEAWPSCTQNAAREPSRPPIRPAGGLCSPVSMSWIYLRTCSPLSGEKVLWQLVWWGSEWQQYRRSQVLGSYRSGCKEREPHSPCNGQLNRLPVTGHGSLCFNQFQGLKVALKTFF